MRRCFSAMKTRPASHGCLWFASCRPVFVARIILLSFEATVSRIKTFGARTAPSLVLLVTAMPVLAGPQGGQVVAGQGSIQQPNTTTTVIQQQSGSMVIDWQSFDVASQETVRFEQPSSSAATLNQINQQRPSEIFGSVEANGRVFLINPNGIIFGKESQVNVGALVASSLTVSVTDFMQGHYVFGSPPDQQPGRVINRGLIQAASGGSVTLMGGAVLNEGLIVAEYGQVNLAAGSAMSLDFDGDGLIRFQVDEALANTATDVQAAVDNSGSIRANGGEVLLTASAAQDVFTRLVNNSGHIEAGRIDNSGGTVRLISNGGATIHSGDIDVSAQDNQSSGGNVQLQGDQVSLTDGSHIYASGGNGGGTVLVGGDFQGNNPDVKNARQTTVAATAIIEANAGNRGDGGNVIVWSDNATGFAGSISARGGSGSGNGGIVEVSGKQALSFTGSVDTSAPNGQTGSLLIDPATLTIVDAMTDSPVWHYNKHHHEHDADDSGSSCRRDPGNTISWGTIDSLASDTNIILQATGDITIQDITGAAGGDTTLPDLVMLDLDQGSLSMISDNGSVVFQDVNDVVRTEGGSITVQANGGHIIAGGLDTTGAAGNTSGAVQLAALTDITLQSINAGSSDVTLHVDTGNNQAATLQLTGSVAGGNVHLMGGSADDTLVGANTDNAWLITGADSGTLNTMDFEQFANLSGGDMQDSFRLEGGSLSGQVDGGAGSDSLTGSTSYQITGPDSGNAEAIGTALTEKPGFINTESLTGSSGNDIFAFQGSNAMVSGSVDGGAGIDVLDYSNHVATQVATQPLQTGASEISAPTPGIKIDLQNHTATATGGMQNMETFVGSAGLDTIIGSNSDDNSWRVNEDNTISLNDTLVFENIEILVGGNSADSLTGPDSDSVWHLAGIDTGTLHDWQFTNMESLNGGSANDHFIFADGARVTGIVDGGAGFDVLDYSAWTTPLSVNLENHTVTSNSDTGIVASAFDNAVDSAGFVVPDDNARTIPLSVNPENTTVTSSSVTGIVASDFDNIEQVTGGTESDTLVAANSENEWHITGVNSGDINETFYFYSIENLTGGNSSDTFAFNDGTSVSGNVNGADGIDQLDFSAYTTAITVNLQNKTATGLNNFYSIEALTGGSASDTLVAENINNTWNITGINSGDINQAFFFYSIENLTGGNATDRFVFNDGMKVTGVVDGGGGTDILDYENWKTGIAVDLENNKATGTGGIKNIEIVSPEYPVTPEPWDVIEQTYIPQETAHDITDVTTEELEKRAILNGLAKLLGRPEINYMSTDVLYSLDGQPDKNSDNFADNIPDNGPDIILRIGKMDDWQEYVEELKRQAAPVDRSVRYQQLLFAMAGGGDFPARGAIPDTTLTDGPGSGWGFVKVASATGQPLNQTRREKKFSQYALKRSPEGNKIRQFISALASVIKTSSAEVLTEVITPVKSITFFAEKSYAAVSFDEKNYSAAGIEQ